MAAAIIGRGGGDFSRTVSIMDQKARDRKWKVAYVIARSEGEKALFVVIVLRAVLRGEREVKKGLVSTILPRAVRL